MITIDQLLESVDLEFEPRWITKDKNGLICIYTEKPLQGVNSWYDEGKYIHIGHIKLSEFDGKDWTECIYEIPRKAIEKIVVEPHEQFEPVLKRVIETLNTVVDTVNELKGATNDK